MPRARGGRSDSEVGEFILEFENHTLGGFLSNSGHAGEFGSISAANGANEVAGAHTSQDVDSEFGADAADGEQLFKQRFLLREMKAEERNLIFTHIGVNEQRHLAAG